MRTIDKLIVHCSATKAGQYFDASDIDRWHKERGWSGIGYHYVILLDGTRQKGRDESVIGAHVTSHNAHSIGICYIGGLDSTGKAFDTRTDAQKIELVKILRELKGRYPAATIHGHREFSNKHCPCFDAKNEYRYIGNMPH